LTTGKKGQPKGIVWKIPPRKPYLFTDYRGGGRFKEGEWDTHHTVREGNQTPKKDEHKRTLDTPKTKVKE